MSPRITRLAGALLVLLAAGAGYARVAAQQAPQQPSSTTEGRFLGREEIRLYGLNLSVEPASQVVPKDMATIVSTFLQTPTPPPGQTLSPFAPDAEVRATLRGPSLPAPVELVVKPGNPFNIPALKIAGVHTLDNIRLVSNGEVLLRGTPESARIEVIEKLLVSQVTARPLTADEIREKGIVFDKSNFQAYNFTAAFAIQDNPISINFPVLLPRLLGADAPTNPIGSLPSVPVPSIPRLETLVPDTLQLQTRLPNLQVVGFSLKVPTVKDGNLIVPPIPGIIAIPGDIGFLNQYFSVMLMVGNVAPAGSGLVVSDLAAEIVLPPGRDNVPKTPDDPLRMAMTAKGEVPQTQFVTQPGPDSRLGTADDIRTLGPGQSGNAEYLVEGRREGSHTVEMRMKGTLHGLPVGPVEVTGSAVGAVLVRNPTFALTFTHPEIVSAGEEYALDVTVTNTSASLANFVSVNLQARDIGGATLVGAASQDIDSILPGDSATVSFALRAKVTGRVFAATLDADEGVSGSFALKTSVGELGVPLSPDSLVLPTEAGELPKPLRDAAIGLLGKAWAVATAPPAAVPAELTRFSRKIVLDRAVEIAEAGLRVQLQEPLADSTAQLALDVLGSNFPRLPQRTSNAEALAFEQNNYRGFDLLRRLSVRGDVFADEVAKLLQPSLASLGAAAFHEDLAEKISYRPGVMSVLVSANGTLPVQLAIVDPAGRTTGGVNSAGKVTKAIPFSDVLRFRGAPPSISSELALVAAPESGTFTVRLTPAAGAALDAPFTLSVVVPTVDGQLRHVTFNNVTAGKKPVIAFGEGALHRVAVEWVNGPVAVDLTSSKDAPIVDPPPSVISVIQRAAADQIICEADQLVGPRPGRIIAVLFSEEVTPATVQDRAKVEAITNYGIADNAVVGVALQPGRRIAYLALRDPFGPLVPRSLTVNGVADPRGHVIASQTMAITPTVADDAGKVSGQVLRADGTPAAFANVRLFYRSPCNDMETSWVGISSKTTDAQGRFAWDFVLTALPARIVAVDSETGDIRDVRFHVRNHGQQVNVNVVFLGRGTFSGRTLAADGGTPLKDTFVRVTSLTDQSQYSARSDALGRFTITGVPVGNFVVDAVNTTAVARTTVSDFVPFAGATTTQDLLLLDASAEPITIKRGHVTGFVLEDEGRPAAGVPVIAYYQSRSQPDIPCPKGAPECAVAVANTDSDGGFEFKDIVAGSLRLQTFNPASFEQGQVGVQLVEAQTVSANIVLAGGLGKVHGVVLDSANRPVAGAQVGGGLSLVTTDSEGRFTLTDVPVGRREIVAVSTALGSRARVFVDLLYTGQEVNATLVLDAMGSVSGVVTRATGAPVANVPVHVFKKEGQSIQVLGTATTNVKGGYRIDGIPVGDYRVSAFSSDFSDGNIVAAVVKFHSQVVRADVQFRGGGGRVTGFVYADDGKTPLRARVGVSAEQVVVAGGVVGVEFKRIENFRIVDTNLQTGRYEVTGLFVGPFTVRAAGAFSPDPVALESTMPAPGQEVQVNLRLQPTSQLTGTVFLPDGVTPVPANVAVHFKSDSVKTICTENSIGETICESFPQGVQSADAVTNDLGTFTFPLLNAGKYTLTVDGPGGRTVVAKGNLAAGQQGRHDIRLLGRGDVTVTVRAGDAKTPIPGARVEVMQVGAPTKKVTFTADTNGVATFTGADAFFEGEIVVLATDVRNGASGRARGRLLADEQPIGIPVFLDTSVGLVFGRVVRPDGFTPVPNAEVVISRNSDAIAFAVTDAQGKYREVGIALGEVKVDVFDPVTGRRGSAAGQIATNGTQLELNVTQEAIGVVRGQLVAAVTLQPLNGWRVTLGGTTAAGRSMPGLVTTTGVDGSFSFPGTPLGRFTINALKPGQPGSGSAQGILISEGQLVEIPVIATIPRTAEGRVEGTVVDHAGGAVASARVEVRRSGSSVPDVVTADSSGRFVYGPTALGRYQIRASRQGSNDSGTSAVDVLFDTQTAVTSVVLNGLSTVTGIVMQNNAPVPNASVSLVGQPQTACEGSCSGFAGPDGRFRFERVSARTFTVVASTPGNTLHGSVSDVLNPGQEKSVTVVLEPTRRVSGRALDGEGQPLAGVVGELQIGQRTLFAESAGDGTFAFAAAPLGEFRLDLRDATGPGMASRRGTIANDVALGDITLDEAAPSVLSVTPLPSAIAVARSQAITLLFSEPIDRASINALSVALSGPSGTVLLDLPTYKSGDTEVTFQPVSPLDSESLYTLMVSGVRDRAGRSMPGPFTTTFTTVDVTAPAVLDVSPAANANGVTTFTTIRVRFSEAVAPEKFAQPVFEVTQGSGEVEGRIDFILGNTVAVFTPNVPLDEDSSYRVRMSRAFDLSGNQAGHGLDYVFSTTDRTPPQILGLVAAGNGTVIENGFTEVQAEVGASHDVLFVDFYLNDQIAFTSRKAPFAMTLQALPALGGPGSSIKVSALATDTSGNRSHTPVSILVPITPDATPTVTLLQPANGGSVPNGSIVNIGVRSTDDVSVARLGYRVTINGTVVTGAQPIAGTVRDASHVFQYQVPAGAAPGATVRIEPTAIDSKGQAVVGNAVELRVLDSAPPDVAITGLTSGARVRPGQTTTVVVAAEDAGLVKSVAFAATGAASFTQTRAIDPGQASVAASFTFTVPASAKGTESITLSAAAVDAAGNKADAAKVIVPVADVVPPTVTLRTPDGANRMVPGTPLTVIVEANDELGVTRVELTGSGARPVADGRTIDPPDASAEETFTIQIPDTVPPGATLQLQARAFDAAENVSAAATLIVTAADAVNVQLPGSVIVNAGATKSIDVTLTAAAGASGVRVDLSTLNTHIATVTSPVLFAPGETTKTATVTGVAGGSTDLIAKVQDVERARMTVTVQGGIVTGIVRDPDQQPVIGALVTVQGGTTRTAETDGAGRFTVQGITGTSVKIRALHEESGLYGVSQGTMAANGFLSLDVQLIDAGSITGVVRRPNGAAVGAGVQVAIFTPSGQAPEQVVFTNQNGQYEFALVAVGQYRLDASDDTGNRGRSDVSLAGAQQLEQDVVFLARGTVTGVVLTSTEQTVAGAQLTFKNTSLFGSTTITATSGPQGEFEFTGVFAGNFTVEAKVVGTGEAGKATGSIVEDQSTEAVTVTLSPVGTLAGIVRRVDESPVSGATVAVGARTASTNEAGQYSFDFMPVGSFTVNASVEGTREVGRASGTIVAGQTTAQDIELAPQGRLSVTVNDDNGAVSGATVTVSVSNGTFTDSLSATTGGTGNALIEHVLAGAYTVTASAGALSATASGVLGAGETKPVTLTLRALNTITGTVYLPGGQQHATAGRVGFVGGTKFADITANGTYTLRDVTDGTYTLYANDATGRRRALAKITVAKDSGTITRDLEFVGVGTVKGRVLNGSTGVAKQSVSVVSQHPSLGHTVTVTTDGAGFYQADNIVQGAIFVSSGTNPLRGEASGVLDRSDMPLTLDILLTNNATTLPRSLYDANGSRFEMRLDGGLGAQQAGFRNAFVLDIIKDGQSIRFVGDGVPTIENAGRELATRQNNLGGLNVARKLFVPATGYFGRWLEILSNPTEAPITVGVRVTAFVGPNGGTNPDTSVIQTSSGDDIIDVAAPQPDRWVVVDDAADADPNVDSAGIPAVAFVFDGAGAARRAGEATHAVDPSSTTEKNVVRYTWQNITVAPGQSVALMHFGVRQMGRDAAIASAERLVQLPPEALAALNPDEIPVISNFAVPADGNSAIEPLPPVNGRITGRVLAGDGETLVKGATTTVRLKSDSVLYGRTYSFSASSAEGTFSLQSDLDDTTPIAISVGDGFTLNGRHPETQIDAPEVHGAFTEGQLTATADLVFSGTGVVLGQVKRHTGALVTSGSVTLLIPGRNVQRQLNGSSNYVYTGVPPGVATLRISHTPSGGGTAIVGSVDVTVLANQRTEQDLIIESTGGLTGVVKTASGGPAVGVTVTVSRSGFSRTRETDTGGNYTFLDLPLGEFTVSAEEPVTNLDTGTIATVVQDVTTPVTPLTLIGYGSVTLQVKYGSGLDVGANVGVQFRESARGTAVRSTGTNVNGQVVLNDVAAGPFVIRAIHPADTTQFSEIAGTMEHGQKQQLTILLPKLGKVVGHVRYPGGAKPGVVLVDMLGEVSRTSLNTNADGDITFNNVPGGKSFTIRGYTSASNRTIYGTSQVQQITSDNENLDVHVTLPALATLEVTVMQGEQVATGARVAIKNAFVTSFGSPVTVNSTTGMASFSNVPQGVVQIRVTNSNNAVLAEGEATITADDHAKTVRVTLHSGVTLPRSLTDANGFVFDVQATGRVLNGSTTNDAGTVHRAYDSGVNLRLFANGSPLTFSGNTVAALEANGRELVIRDLNAANLGGLEVARKVFVPSLGYFARYLELLHNPTLEPITVDVEIASDLDSEAATRIVDETPGEWIVTDDDPGNDPWPSSDQTLAHVFGRAGRLNPPAVTVPTATMDTLSYRWNSITVEPGETVALMHFAVQQPTAAAAQASAIRLGQLPPEALQDLNAAEIAAVSNFDVPEDGVGTVPPLLIAPAFTLTGQIFTWNGITAANPRNEVTLRSSNPIYSKEVKATLAASSYSLTGTIADGWSLETSNLPPAPFDGWKTSRMSTGAIVPGQTTATENVVFEGTGAISGRVRFGNDAVVTSGTLTFSLSSKTTSLTGLNGVFALPIIPPGSYTMSVTTGARTASTAFTVLPNAETPVDIRMPAVATVRVEVKNPLGSPAVSPRVSIAYVGGVQTLFPASGIATFTGVQEGDFSIFTRENNGNGLRMAETTGVVGPLDEGKTIDVPLSLNALVTLRAIVKRAGVAVAQAPVEIKTSQSDSYKPYGVTNGDGIVLAANVPSGPYQLRVRNTAGTIVVGSLSGTIPLSADGQTVDAPIDLSTDSVALQGTLFAGDGTTPLAGYQTAVRLFDGDVQIGEHIGSTGTYVFTEVPRPASGTLRLRTHYRQWSTTFVEQDVAIAAGPTTVHNVTVPVSGISGQVVFWDPSVPHGTDIRIQFDNDQDEAWITSDEQGRFNLFDVPVGGFVMTAYNWMFGNLYTVAAGTITAATDVVKKDLVFGRITGAVRHADGSPAPNPAVFATQVVRPDLTITYDAISVAANGTFEIIGPAPGEATVTALRLMLEGATPTTVPLPPAAVDVDVQLEPDGVVTGTVRNGTTVLSQVTVVLSIEGLDRFATTDGNGQFRFEHVKHGPFALQARLGSGESAQYVRVTGTLTGDPDSGIVTVQFPVKESVAGNVIAEGGGGAADAEVIIENQEHAGPLGGFTRTVQANAGGAFTADDIPVGQLRVSAFSGVFGGWKAVTLATGTPATVEIQIGSLVKLTPPYLLESDTFRFAVDCHGRIASGGRPNDQWPTYTNAFALNVDGRSFACVNAATFEDNRRELVLDGGRTGALRVVRKVYVPEAGGYARYLEVITNHGATAQMIPVLVTGQMGSASRPPNNVVSAQSTGLRYAVTNVAGVGALGFAMASTGAAVRVGDAWFSSDTSFYYQWDLTVPAGGTVILMHFAQQDADSGTATIHAQELATMTRSGMLNGMSAQEKAQVVNFKLQ